MKLIIDIDDETYKNVTFYGTYLCPRDKEELERALKNAKPIEEQPKGKWTDRNGRIVYPELERYRCSVCGQDSDRYNFCPNCGADMRGDDK